MAKHTKGARSAHSLGPWTLDPVTTKAARSKLALSCTTHRICDITVHDERDLANARLMAAAPTLYLALVSSLGKLDDAANRLPNLHLLLARELRDEADRIDALLERVMS